MSLRYHASCLLALSVLFASASSLFAQTSYPMLMSVKPVAVQAGSTIEATVQSRYSLDGAFQVLVSGGAKGVRSWKGDGASHDRPAPRPLPG